MFYRIREKIAYSTLGKTVATMLRNLIWKKARVHWVQQSMADASFHALRHCR